MVNKRISHVSSCERKRGLRFEMEPKTRVGVVSNFLPAAPREHRIFHKSVITTHENPYKSVILRQLIPENRKNTESFTPQRDRSAGRQGRSLWSARTYGGSTIAILTIC